MSMRSGACIFQSADKNCSGKKRDTCYLIQSIVIKPDPGVDPAKGPGPGFQGSTRVNPEKLKKK